MCCNRWLIIAFLAIISISYILFLQRKPSLPAKSIMDKTFAIIKPHAVQEGNADKIIDVIKQHGFTILASKQLTMTKAQAEQFYAVHKDRPFYGELVDMMTSGPVIVMVLQKPDAVKQWRELMGATDPNKAAEGTIRKEFAKNIGQNAVHGSDSEENAIIEIRQFFPDLV